MKASHIISFAMGALIAWLGFLVLDKKNFRPDEVYEAITDLSDYQIELGEELDTVQIEQLKAILRPLLFSSCGDRELENWYARRTEWTQRFGSSANIFKTAGAIFNEYLLAADFANAAIIKNSIARIYLNDGNATEALEASQAAYELAQQVNDSTSLGWSLFTMSEILYISHDNAAAREYGLRALSWSQEIGHPNMEASTQIILGALENREKQIKASFRRMREALEIASAHNLVPAGRRAILNLGYLYNQEKKYDEAIEIISNNIDLEQLPPTSRPSLFLCYNLHDSYLGKKDYQKAAFYLDKGCQMAASSGYVYAQFHCARNKMELFQQQGLPEKALIASKEMYAIKDEISKNEQTQAIKSIKTKLSLLEKDLEIEKLNQTKSEIQQVYSQRFTTFIIITTFLLFFIPGIYFFMLSQSKVKQAEQQKKLAELKLQVLQSQMNPHFVFNALVGVQNYILKSDHMEAYSYISKFANLLRTISGTSTQMLIPFDEEINFIRSYLELEKLRFRDNFVYTITVDPDLENTTGRIPRMIIQPIVENALLHGINGLKKQGELTINVDHCCQSPGIRCTITDNGRGRKAARALANDFNHQEHLSIATANTSKRLDFLKNLGFDNIDLEVIDLEENGKPQGTKVVIYLPFVEEEQLLSVS